MAEKRHPSLALQARPDKKSGQKEHQLHEVEKRKGAKQVEAEPALRIDDRKGAPIVRRRIEGERVQRLGDDVGGKAVKGQNQQNRHPAQISEWQAGFGHGLKSLKCRRRRGESVLFIDINRETAAKFHTAQTWLRIFGRGMVSHTLPGRRSAQLLALGRSSIGP